MTDALPTDVDPTALDWERWEVVLNQFAAASGLVVSLYDRSGNRRVGPIAQSKLSRALAALGLWSSGSAASRAEKDLAARCMASQCEESASFCAELQLRALPVLMYGEMRGAVVFGWVFCGFPSVFFNERLARELDIPPSRLWRDLRLQPPVSSGRMKVFAELLQTLVDSNVHQAEAIEHLQTLAQTRDVLLAQISHDLRTPLTAISLRLETLLASDLGDPDNVRQILERMRASAAEEARLIEELIDAARTRTGQMSLQRSAMRLSTVVERAVSEVAPLAEQNEVTLQLFCGITDAEPQMHADPNRMHQVFWNLISNAVKFSAKGARVTVVTRLEGDRFEVRVRDEGAGIDTAILPRIFDPFVKRDEGNSHGLGLGLSIAKHIVELHGGSIEAHSAGRGRGSEFVVRLPTHGSRLTPD